MSLLGTSSKGGFEDSFERLSRMTGKALRLRRGGRVKGEGLGDRKGCLSQNGTLADKVDALQDICATGGLTSWDLWGTVER